MLTKSVNGVDFVAHLLQLQIGPRVVLGLFLPYCLSKVGLVYPAGRHWWRAHLII